MQLKEKHAPFLLGVHCATHQTNLVMQTLSWLFLVAKIEALLQVVYNYYAQSPKWSLEKTKFVDFLENKVLKMLHNVKTH
jgi:hypothetical protein